MLTLVDDNSGTLRELREGRARLHIMRWMDTREHQGGGKPPKMNSKSSALNWAQQPVPPCNDFVARACLYVLQVIRVCAIPIKACSGRAVRKSA